MRKIVTKMCSALVKISALRVKFQKKYIKYWPGIKIYSSMHTLPKYYSEILLFLTLARIYKKIAWVVCKPVVVLPVFLCRAH